MRRRLWLMLFLVVLGSAGVTSSADELEDKLNRLRQDCPTFAQKAADQIKESRAKMDTARNAAQYAPPQVREEIESRNKRTDAMIGALEALVKQTTELASQSSPSTATEKREMIERLSNALGNGRLYMQSVDHDLRVDLDDLRARAAIADEARKDSSPSASRAIMERAWGTDQKPGGVFLNETASIPALRGERLDRVEYDRAANRFVLYGDGRSWLFPDDGSGPRCGRHTLCL